jgi:ubiquinone/menaquinone biosynthesis C-methylase UbiE
MRLFFRLLYHSMSWSYDLVATVVSLGRWKDWVKQALPLISGTRVLELGFGPGHMQGYLASAGNIPFGLDESRQMARQARRRLLRQRQVPRLARGLAQHLPFASRAFNSVVATFPTLYIVDPQTLAEIRRVLTPGGRLVVLSTAWVTGKSLPERIMSWVFNITGESPSEEINLAKIVAPFTEAGFQASIRFAEPKGSRLMFIVAKVPLQPKA